MTNSHKNVHILHFKVNSHLLWKSKSKNDYGGVYNILKTNTTVIKMKKKEWEEHKINNKTIKSEII